MKNTDLAFLVGIGIGVSISVVAYIFALTLS